LALGIWEEDFITRVYEKGVGGKNLKINPRVGLKPTFWNFPFPIVGLAFGERIYKFRRKEGTGTFT